MDDVDGLDGLDDQITALEQSLGAAEAVTASFGGQLQALGDAMEGAGQDAGQLSGGLTRSLRKSFDGLLLDGQKLSDVLTGLAQSMAQATYSAAIQPVATGLGGALATGVEGLVAGLLPFEKGGSFTQGRVMPFARGGVVTSPTAFPMRGGTGLMGEAGPEAIMPLARGADGRLGVRAESDARPVNVVMNVSTPDADSFNRSQSQIAAQLGRAISRGQRNT